MRKYTSLTFSLNFNVNQCAYRRLQREVFVRVGEHSSTNDLSSADVGLSIIEFEHRSHWTNSFPHERIEQNNDY